jgi:hypothetical protein
MVAFPVPLRLGTQQSLADYAGNFDKPFGHCDYFTTFGNDLARGPRIADKSSSS